MMELKREPGERVVKYMRRSKAEENVLNQDQACDALIAREQWVCIKTYDEISKGEYGRDKRPTLAQFFEDMKVLKPTRVIVYHPDRFTREGGYEFVGYIREMHNLGIMLTTYQNGDMNIYDEFNVVDEIQQEICYLYGLVAAMEVKSMSRRVKRSQARIKEQIEQQGFAISKDGKKIFQAGGRHKVEVSGEERAEIINMHKATYSYQEIVERMQQKNSRITERVVRRIIKEG